MVIVMSIAVRDETAKAMIDTLEKISDEIDGAIETIEILGDEETLKSIEAGLKDIKEGNIVAFEDFLKKHGYK